MRLILRRPGVMPALPESVLTHKLLNQLSILKGACDLLMEGSTMAPEKGKLLSLIRENVRTMTEEIRSYEREARSRK